MPEPTFQDDCFVGFANLIVVLLMVEDHEIIVDMVDTVVSEVSDDQRHTIRGELERTLKEVAAETGNAFWPMALAIARYRNTRLRSTHFVSIV
jgi:hypothetical protein